MGADTDKALSKIPDLLKAMEAARKVDGANMEDGNGTKQKVWIMWGALIVAAAVATVMIPIVLANNKDIAELKAEIQQCQKK